MGRSKAKVLNWLTLAAVGAWLASLMIRAMNPATISAFASIDPIILLIIGYWFSRGHEGHERNGNGS